MCQECVPFIFVHSPDKVQIKQPPPRKSSTDLATATGSDTSRRFKKFTALCGVGTKKPRFEWFGKREPLEQDNGKPKEENGGHDMDSVDQVDESTVRIGDLQPRRGRKRRKRNTNDHNPLYIAATECSQGEFKISDESIVGSEIWPPSCGEPPPCARQRDQSMASALVESGKKTRVEMWFCKQGRAKEIPYKQRLVDGKKSKKTYPTSRVSWTERHLGGSLKQQLEDGKGRLRQPTSRDNWTSHKTSQASDGAATRNDIYSKFNRLESYYPKLVDLNEKYQALLVVKEGITEESIDREWQECDKYEEEKFDIQQKVSVSRNPDKEETIPIASEDTVINVKLPELALKSYDGSLEGWLPWWAQFSKIHENKNLSDSDRFLYLRQAIVPNSEAYRVVASYPVTGANYALAVQALQERFGDPNILTELYVRRLLNSVISNVKKENRNLSSLYDELSSHLRSLETLGIDPQLSGIFLYPLVESSLPSDILKIWHRHPSSGYGMELAKREEADKGVGGAQERLRLLLDFLKAEVRSAQRLKFVEKGFKQEEPYKRSYNDGTRTRSNFRPATVSSLFGGRTNIKCFFCERTNHASHQCRSIMKLSPGERNDKIRSAHLCFKCLRKGHTQSQCREQLECKNCGRNHLEVLCEGNSSNRLTKPGRENLKENATEPIASLSSQACTGQVLLMTTVALLRGPNASRRVRVLLDSGSQFSYIKQSLVWSIGIERKGEITIAKSLFGGNKIGEEKHGKFMLELENLGNKRDVIHIEALDQRKICDAIPPLPKGDWLEKLKIKGIILSQDNFKGQEIDILIGANYLGMILTGKIVQVEADLTAVETKLGWTLMGNSPIIDSNDNVQQTLNLLTTRCDLKDLWDLEVLGIRDPVETCSKETRYQEIKEKFITKIQRQSDQRYSVGLPWKLETKQEVQEFQKAAIEIMDRAKMDLREWEYSLEENPEKGTCTKILGVVWNKMEDSLKCELPDNLSLQPKLTKRLVLSMVQRIFDPLGFCAPVFLPPKLLLQRSWGLKLGWDTPLPESMAQEFRTWLDQMKFIELIKIPRYMWNDLIFPTEVHIFCDASQIGYGAVAYLRSETGRENTLTLIWSKVRLAPMKSITIPRLELMAMVLGARLANAIQAALKRKCETTLWSDSTTALSWIKKEIEWRVFVRNRVREIQATTNLNDWRFVPSQLNPADLLSRGCPPSQFVQSRWWEGPEWLKKPKEFWPNSEFSINSKEIKVEENIMKTNINLNIDYKDWLLTRRSNYSLNIRVMSYVLRFLGKLKKQSTETGPLKVSELDLAEKKLIRMIQEKVSIEKSNATKSFKILKNTDGLWCVESKLLHGQVPGEFKTPIILPGDHPFVEQLIWEVHLKNGHVGVQFILSKLREKFWIIRGRKTIKKIISKCIACKRLKEKSLQRPMAALPENRIGLGKPFQITGVDLLGPLHLKEGGKVWVAAFTCAVYRAIHLELVKSLETGVFMMALHRFICRRGRPEKIYSDNGTNFAKLNRIFKRLDWIRIERETSIKRIQWIFIPPSAPWWGGFWEGMVRTIKEMLIKMLGHRKLKYVQLQTALCEIESIINNRPLTYVSEDDNDLKPLTPNEFLQNGPESSFPEFENLKPEMLHTRYRELGQLKRELKQRFLKEYLGALIQKSENIDRRQLKVGDVVLIGQENLKRMFWPKGRIVNLIPGKDGIVRVAHVKTSTGTLIRALQRLHPLEISSNVETIQRDNSNTEPQSEAYLGNRPNIESRDSRNRYGRQRIWRTVEFPCLGADAPKKYPTSSVLWTERSLRRDIPQAESRGRKDILEDPSSSNLRTEKDVLDNQRVATIGHRTRQAKPATVLPRVTEMKDQRICIKFCVKNGFKGAEIFWMLQTAYGVAVMSRRRVFEWHKPFKEGREETADNERSRRPSTSTTPEKVDKVLELVREDRRITVRKVAEEAGISFGSTQSIIKDILGMRRLNAVLAPKDLTFNQKNAAKKTASLNLEATTDDPEFMKWVITRDEKWIYGFDSETIQQASEWRFKNEPRPKKARKAPSKVKVMLTVFFDYQGIVHHEFQQQGSTITGSFEAIEGSDQAETAGTVEEQ
ncbi:hypothetical protein LAZ67_3004584, partial [Cordylochernes scorpioides]